MENSGKRAADRDAESFPRAAAGWIAASVVALGLWVYLVWSAIHFGSRARGGNTSEWLLVAAMTVGAIAALFVCLMLAAKAATRLGLLPANETVAAPPPPRGGKRAAR